MESKKPKVMFVTEKQFGQDIGGCIEIHMTGKLIFVVLGENTILTSDIVERVYSRINKIHKGNKANGKLRKVK